MNGNQHSYGISTTRGAESNGIVWWQTLGRWKELSVSSLPEHLQPPIMSCLPACLPACLQGKTVEVGRAHFETDKKRYTILDAPVSGRGREGGGVGERNGSFVRGKRE